MRDFLLGVGAAALVSIGTALVTYSIFKAKNYIDNIELLSSQLKLKAEEIKNNYINIIRCKDCVYYEDILGFGCFHPMQEQGCNSEGGECLRMNPDDFCSYGKLK